MERLRELLAIDDDMPRRGLRLLAGLLLVVGMLLVFVRRSTLGDPWGDLLLFLVLLAPCVFLYGIGLLAAREDAGTRGWESVYVVAGLLVVPLLGFQFVEVVDGDTGASLNVAWIFALTAAAGALAALLGGVRFALLAAGLAAIVVWLAIFDEVLEDGVGTDIGTFRGLMVLIALILLGAAFFILRRDSDRRPLDRELARGAELVTAAGVAAVIAGAISIASVTILIPFSQPPAIDASLLWDAELIVASLALIAFAAWSGTRGPGYVGGFGLLLFIAIVGLDLDDSSPAGKLIGWPLILLVLAALAFAASLVPGVGAGRFRRDQGRFRRDQGGSPPAPAPASVAVAPEPTAPAQPLEPPTERLDPPPPPPPGSPGESR